MPINAEVGIFATDRANSLFRDFRPGTERGEIQLANPASISNVMEQVVRPAFASKKCHGAFPGCSVRTWHYRVNEKSVPVPKLFLGSTCCTRKGMSWAAVYRLVRRIPRGRVTSYAAIAKKLRLRGGARSAGRAMSACPSGLGIPWHRVVTADGQIVIGEPHAALQKRLLESEGIRLWRGRVDMGQFGWWPQAKQRRKRTQM